MSEPSPMEDNGGRDRRSGRFLPGHQFARGNPHARRVNELRRLLLDTVTDEDLQAVVSGLVQQAKAGQPWAVKELLDRLLGKAPAALELAGPDGEPLGLSLQALTVIVLSALEGHPEARLAVAAKLRELSVERPDGDGGGP